MVVQTYKMYIGGRWVSSESRETYDVLNPANARLLAKVAKGTAEDAKAAVDAARAAFDSGAWSRKTPGERGLYLYRLADLVEKHMERFARLESMNVGKTLKYALNSDMPFVIDNLRFFGGAARMLEGKGGAEYSGMGTSFVRREPVGVVAGIVPWNYPLYIAVWKLAPALAAGNTLVLKPASYTPLTLLEFTKLVEKVGIPKGVFNVVTGPGEVVGGALASSPRVDMISITGDTATGKKIMQLASSNVKKVHLELGGKAPLVVLPDADLDMTAQGAVVGGYWNTGQDCTAVTRVFAPERAHDELVRRMVSRARRFRLGDPLKPKTDLGPLVAERQRERVEGYIQTGVREGARIATGGGRPRGAEVARGFFLEPTILTGAEQGMRVCREEIFGPVITVLSYDDLDGAIAQANDVKYGLAASVYGKDAGALMRAAAQLDFGTVWVNEHGVLVSEMPHGGFKQSGFGKDLSLYSLEEYTRVKHVYVDTTGSTERSWHWTVYGQPPKG